MYRAMCKCGGYVDFKRSRILNTHRCNKCHIILVSTQKGEIYPSSNTKIKGYFKVGNIKNAGEQIE